MNNISKLKKFIHASKLRAEEQFDFILLCSSISEEDATVMLELFQKDVSWVEKVFKNYSQKNEAFSSGDVEAMKKILIEERATIEQIV